MNDIAVLQNKIVHLEKEMSSIKQLLQRVLAKVEHSDAPQKQVAAAELSAFLRRVHTTMPDVPEAEVWRDIEEASRSARPGT
jgi:hypothetical protein